MPGKGAQALLEENMPPKGTTLGNLAYNSEEEAKEHKRHHMTAKEAADHAKKMAARAAHNEREARKSRAQTAKFNAKQAKEVAEGIERKKEKKERRAEEKKGRKHRAEEDDVEGHGHGLWHHAATLGSAPRGLEARLDATVHGLEARLGKAVHGLEARLGAAAHGLEARLALGEGGRGPAAAFAAPKPVFKGTLTKGKMPKECMASDKAHAHEQSGEPCRFVHKNEKDYDLLLPHQKREGPPKAKKGGRKTRRSGHSSRFTRKSRF